jgi:spermidine/putrescine transport system permease protein
VVTLVGLLIPLALLPMYSSMSNVSREHLDGARDLGSRGFHLHRTILIPMTLPGLNTAFAIAFILSVGDFVVPTMLGGAQGTMIGNVIADQFKGSGSNWPLGAAMAFLIMAIMLAVYLVVTRALKWVTRW